MPETLLAKLLVGAALFLFGAIMTHYWTRFRGRLCTLSWSATTTRLAVTTQDTGYGKAQVLYNGQAVNNLYMVAVVLRNESRCDVTDVVVNLVFLDGTAILLSEGTLVGSPNPLAVDPKFMADWRALSHEDAPPGQLGYYQTRRDYCVPVFNRGSVARLDVLVTQFADNTKPCVNLAVDHPTVQVKDRTPIPEFLGVPQARAKLVGAALAIVVTTGVVMSFPSPWVVASVSLVAGLCAIILGAATIRSIRVLTRVLS